MNSFTRISMLAALLLAGPAWSEDKKCNNDETITDCVERLVFQGVAELRTETAIPEASEANAKATANEVAKKDQAGTSTGTGQASSTFTDLLPWFNALGLLSDSDASDGTLAFDLNFLLLQSKKKANHNSQLKWVLDVSPEPYEPLIAALPEDVQEERKKTLQSKIEDTADSEIQYTFSVVNGYFGRDFRPHYGQLSSLIAPVIANAGASGDDQLRGDARARFLVGLVSLRSELMAMRPGDASGAVDTRTMNAFTAAEKAKVEKFVNAQRNDLAVAMAKHLDSIAVAIRDPNIDALTNLVLLQPQLTFSLNHQIRNELVGPEATGIRITFEKSFVDFNAFLKSSAASCSKLERATTSTSLSIDEAKTCLEAAGQYVERNAEDLENESRWKASLEYKQVDRWQYALPDDGIAMDRPKYDRVVASAGFGRALPRSTAKDRIDFEASYDSNLDSDDNYKSRLVATLTYTRRIADMDIPFSIVYANKSEFLEGVDEQIGLHVGVKFRGVDKDK